MSTIEMVATLFGLACVLLTVREHMWCWYTGFVQVTLYVWIFHGAKLYSDMILSAIYMPMQVFGWYMWRYGGARRDALPVTRLTSAQRTRWGLGSLVLTALWGYGMATYTDAALPYWDATTTVLSLAAQWLMAKKVLESWLLWVAVDVLSVGIYAVKGLYPTMVLYAVFLGLATWGFVRWRESERARPCAA